jgi:hypothetical protein
MGTRGWNDIAYSFLVNHEGTIYEGRGVGIAGGHTAGHNTISHAVCLLGNFEVDRPTEAAVASLVELGRHGHAEGWWREGFTGGHRDASGASTSCPGKFLYTQLATVNAAIQKKEAVDMYAPCKQGDKGVHVEAWQRVIQRISGFAPAAWGTFGADTTTELQRLTGPGDNIGPSEGAVLLDLLGASDAGGLTEAQVKALINDTQVVARLEA